MNLNELRNRQIMKKMLEMSIQLLLSDQTSESKSLNVALNISGVEKYPQKICGYGQHWRPFDSGLRFLFVRS